MDLRQSGLSMAIATERRGLPAYVWKAQGQRCELLLLSTYVRLTQLAAEPMRGQIIKKVSVSSNL